MTDTGPPPQPSTSDHTVARASVVVRSRTRKPIPAGRARIVGERSSSSHDPAPAAGDLRALRPIGPTSAPHRAAQP